MGFDWKEYYTFASSLVGRTSAQVSDEAQKRIAISRAYYSVLLQAREVACRRSGKKYKPYHRWTMDELSKDSDPSAKRVSSWLARLKKRRERADYHDTINGLDREVKSTFLEAERILNELKTL